MFISIILIGKEWDKSSAATSLQSFRDNIKLPSSWFRFFNLWATLIWVLIHWRLCFSNYDVHSGSLHIRFPFSQWHFDLDVFLKFSILECFRWGFWSSMAMQETTCAPLLRETYIAPAFQIAYVIPCQGVTIKPTVSVHVAYCSAVRWHWIQKKFTKKISSERMTSPQALLLDFTYRLESMVTKLLVYV